MAQVMPSRPRTQTAPLLTVLLLLVMPVGVLAGFVKVWQLQETAAAPVLVVGRVLGVQKVERLPQGSLPWKNETWAMTADVQVLRFFTNSGDPHAVNRLNVHFLAYGPSLTTVVNGYPPALPN